MGTLDRYGADTIAFPYLGFDFKISPTAFSIFGFEIKWYGICIAIGLFLAMHYCFKRTKDYGIDGDSLVDAVFAGVVGAIIGARAYYVAFHSGSFHTIGEILSIRDGGLAVYGGLIGALFLGIIVCRVKKIKVLPAVDLASMGFFIGQGIGRWGNFFNQEAFGTNTTLPWGMSGGRIQNYIINSRDFFASYGIEMDPFTAVHPCFLYESLWCLAGFLIMHFFYKHRKFDGEMICIYCAWYGVGRAFVESLRTDSLYAGSLRVSQVLSLILSAVGIIMIVAGTVIAKKKNIPLYCTTEESKQILAEAEAKVKEEEETKKARKQKELTADQKIISDEDEEEDT